MHLFTTSHQAGVGTYSAPTMMSGVELWAAKLLDEAFAWYLDAHARVDGGSIHLSNLLCRLSADTIF